ncbi:DNA-binding domain-containing protein [Anabaena catenula FACHB-362]|uniref:DNA-binding domain-containing protein n=1 Tax=Anabaena catenula FACHB-362 TaxID=2692877 RepID=A0ABR8J819_9NOST|nr:DNA-binding domain-containing protein [Anabaena catenula FACHB-362]
MTVEPKTKGLSPRKKAQIAVRVPLYILRKLNNHIEKTGMSQTDIVVNALANYLNSASEIPIIQRIVTLEERVTMLEAK